MDTNYAELWIIFVKMPNITMKSHAFSDPFREMATVRNH